MRSTPALVRRSRPAGIGPCGERVEHVSRAEGDGHRVRETAPEHDRIAVVDEIPAVLAREGSDPLTETG
jgi:hypothetical protein